jgi:hypothetical protein
MWFMKFSAVTVVLYSRAYMNLYAVFPNLVELDKCLQVRYSAIKSPAVTGTTQTGSMMAAVVCNQQKQPLHSSVTQQSGSCQGLDSGLQSDGKHFIIITCNAQLSAFAVNCLQMAGYDTIPKLLICMH